MVSKNFNLKAIFILLVVGLFYLINASTSFAIDPPCAMPPAPPDPRVECKFGTISPPPALKDFLKNDPSGAGAISDFLSRLVVLIFSIATIVLIFMILWGAFEWLTSGGDKEKLSSAQKRIVNAFIGIILFAVAFAIIRVLGTFTGFRLFEGQNYVIQRHLDGTFNYKCPDGSILWPPQKSPICEGHGG